MKEIISWLQLDATQTYEQEGRIRINPKLIGSSTKTTYMFRPPPRTPSPRMLPEIIQDSKLIYRVHGLFVWILRTGQSAIHECLFDAPPTEDQTSQEERKGNCSRLFPSSIFAIS